MEALTYKKNYDFVKSAMAASALSLSMTSVCTPPSYINLQHCRNNYSIESIVRRDNYRINTSSNEVINISKDLVNNLNKMRYISNLKDNWDGYNAKSFSDNLIGKIRNLLVQLDVQPEIFPLPDGRIKFAFSINHNYYIEMDIGNDGSISIDVLNNHGEESNESIIATAEAINMYIGKYYG